MPELRGRDELAAKLAKEIGVAVSRGYDVAGLSSPAMAVEGVELNGDGHPADGAAGIVRYAFGVPFRTITPSGSGTESRPVDPPVLEELLAAGMGQAANTLTTTSPPKKGRSARKVESREELLARLLDPTLTLEETARMLEVCPATVRRYTNRGILPHERSKGNQRRFKLSTVLAFMESQSRVEPHGETG